MYGMPENSELVPVFTDDTLMHRVRVELDSLEDDVPAADAAKEVIFKWLGSKRAFAETARSDGAIKSFEDGELCDDLAFPEATVKTAAFSDDSSAYWSMETDEPDNSVTGLRWRLAVGVTSDVEDDSWCVMNLRLSSYVVPGVFVPKNRVKTGMPRIVGALVDSPLLDAHVGMYGFSTKVTSLTASTFKSRFARELVDPERQVPIIVVSSNSDGSDPDFDVSRMMRLVVGQAKVYYFDYSDKALKYAYGGLFKKYTRAEAYGFRPNSLRVYPAGVDLSRKQSTASCRYFTPATSVPYGGVEGCMEAVARSISQGVGPDPGEVTTISDIDGVRMRFEREELFRDLDELTAPAGGASPADDAMSSAVAELTAQLSDLSARLAESEAARRRAVKDLALARSLKAAPTNADVVAMMKSLPTSPVDAVRTIGEIFPDRIHICPEAIKSAKKWTGPVDEVWYALYSIATTLWDILYESNEFNGRAATHFQSLTGLELSWGESGSTNNDQKFIRMRERTFKGRKYACTQHVKGKNHGRRSFRVYFKAITNDQVILIGNVGDHLPTAGTRHLS